MKKVAVISGATGGIGRAIAERMRETYRLVLIYRNEEKLEHLADFKNDNDVIFVKADVRDDEDCKKVIERTIQAFGSIEVLVNNAGMTRDKLVLQMKREDFEAVIETNLYSVFSLSKYAIKPMLKNKYGKIINIASVIGLTGNGGQSNYAASKAGVIAFTKSLSKEVARKNINVNAICPGFIETQMTEGLETQYIDRIPARRLGRGEDVANMVYFLASDEADYVHGKEFIVDGGVV